MSIRRQDSTPSHSFLRSSVRMPSCPLQRSVPYRR